MPPTRTPDPLRAHRSVFARVAGWSFRHRGLALVAWVVALLAVTAVSSAVGTRWVNDFSLPGTESQRALDTLQERFPQQAGDTADVVFRTSAGEVAAPATRERVDKLLGELRALPHVTDVRSPFNGSGGGQVSGDGKIAYATVALDDTVENLPVEDLRAIVETSLAAGGDGLQVEVGGKPAKFASGSEGGPAEGIGILMALIVLLAVFGSLLAAATPVVTALLAIGITTGVVGMFSHVLDIADYSPIIATLIGLGVGIDYALLVLSRYRSELRHAPREQAVETALDTAGRTVFFAGGTVIIALLGLLALNLGSMTGPAFAAAIAVLVTMLAALTLLPALLAWIGPRIESRRARKAAAAAASGTAAATVHDRPAGRRWEQWAGFVQRRPLPIAVVSVVALLALALPALDMRLGFADAGTDARETTTRQAYDLMAEGFGPGAAGPLLVVAQLPGDAAAADALTGELARELRDTPGVARVAPPFRSEDGSIATIALVPDSKPQDEATTDLLQRVRDDVLPPLHERYDTQIDVGGRAASGADFAEVIAQKMPLFVGIVVGLSSLLLMVVFRSILLPLKAAALNLLSIGAALGAMTLVFQHGVLGGLVGAQPGPIEAFLPVMLFAIVFGLSMDYEVFLLSRVHEEWTRSGDDKAAVRRGLATTGRVITAAASIMVVVFAAFVVMDDRMIKMFGFGLAVAILIDAVVIRCLLVPAIMTLLGKASWWFPSWLDRRVPHVALEREAGGALPASR